MIKTSPRLGEDFLAWAPERNGHFSVRSAYWLAADEVNCASIPSTSSATDGRRDIWRLIWSCPAPPKVLSFAWRAATDSLATWLNKKRRTLEVRADCPVCGREEEDLFHVLCACDNAQRLWGAMAKVWELPTLTNIKRHDDWLLQLITEANEQSRVRVLMLLWRVWYVRNELVHAKPAPPIDVLVRAHVLTEWLRAHVGLPPSPGRVKLNTDGSVLNGVAGTGMVLRDHLGNIIFCACRHVELYDAFESEILAVREGINLALQWSTLPIDIESDCLEAVAMVKNAEGPLQWHHRK